NQSECDVLSRRYLRLSARPVERRLGPGTAGEERGQAGGRQGSGSELHRALVRRIMRRRAWLIAVTAAHVAFAAAPQAGFAQNPEGGGLSIELIDPNVLRVCAD